MLEKDWHVRELGPECCQEVIGEKTFLSLSRGRDDKRKKKDSALKKEKQQQVRENRSSSGEKSKEGR